MKFGAKIGVGIGMTGQCYAIPTKGRRIETLSLAQIGIYVAIFLRVAAANPDREFLVTKIGCGLAGYSTAEIAPLFLRHSIPPNVSLPESFWKCSQ